MQDDFLFGCPQTIVLSRLSGLLFFLSTADSRNRTIFRDITLKVNKLQGFSFETAIIEQY